MSAIPKTLQPSVRDRVNKEEWQTRVDLAAAYQLAHISPMALTSESSEEGCAGR